MLKYSCANAHASPISSLMLWSKGIELFIEFQQTILNMFLWADSCKKEEQSGWIHKDRNYKSILKVVMRLPLKVKLHLNTIKSVKTCVGKKS